MFEFTKEAKPETVDREVLFVIDGVPYTIPVRFRPLEMARYAHMVSQDGADAAAMWALQTALGETGYLAFLNLPASAVSEDQYRGLISVVVGRLLGVEREVPGPKWAPPSEADPIREAMTEPETDRPMRDAPWFEDESLDSSPVRTET